MHNLSCENEFYLHENEKWFPYQRLSTYPRFETETRGNSRKWSIEKQAKRKWNGRDGIWSPFLPQPLRGFSHHSLMHNCDTTASLSGSLERARIPVERLGLLMCGSHSQVWHTNEGGKRSIVQLLIRNRKDSKPFLFSGILFLLKTGNRIECQFQVNAGY